MLSKAPRYRGDISACASSRYQAHFPSGKCGLGSRLCKHKLTWSRFQSPSSTIYAITHAIDTRPFFDQAGFSLIEHFGPRLIVNNTQSLTDAQEFPWFKRCAFNVLCIGFLHVCRPRPSIFLFALVVAWLIIPRCACASEVYSYCSVFVCLCVHVCRLLQLLKDQWSARVSIGF